MSTQAHRKPTHLLSTRHCKQADMHKFIVIGPKTVTQCSRSLHQDSCLPACSAPLDDGSCDCLITKHHSKETRRRGFGVGGGLELSLVREKVGKVSPCSQFLHMQLVFQSDVTSNAEYNIQ